MMRIISALLIGVAALLPAGAGAASPIQLAEGAPDSLPATVTKTTYAGSRTEVGVETALGAVFPSLIIIMIIAAFLTNFADIPAVQNAFAGIRVCVCVLILNAVLKLRKKAVPDLPAAIIFVVVFLTASFTSLSPILFVLVSAVAGILLKVRRVTQE